MVLIGDYSWVLGVVFAALAVLLAVYFTALFIWFRINRAKSAPEAGKRGSAALGSGGKPVPSH